MKKIITTIIITFLFMNHVNAATIEEDINELIENYKALETKLENIEKTALDKSYPIGSIYKTTVYSTDEQVNEAIGGTWERYGRGSMLIGVDTNDNSFNEINKNGGSSTTTLAS